VDKTLGTPFHQTPPTHDKYWPTGMNSFVGELQKGHGLVCDEPTILNRRTPDAFPIGSGGNGFKSPSIIFANWVWSASRSPTTSCLIKPARSKANTAVL